MSNENVVTKARGFELKISQKHLAVFLQYTFCSHELISVPHIFLNSRLSANVVYASLSVYLNIKV